MDRDDIQVGRPLTRREIVALVGATGLGLVAAPVTITKSLAAAALPKCVVRPEQTEGPYFVEEQLYRSDIRADPVSTAVKAGVLLDLAIVVSRVARETCSPLADARVDLWQCDADGVYSDVRDPNFSTIGQQFLRGHQLTDAGGTVRFRTIYPGWYPGRTVHLHFKIRTDPAAARGHEFVSQLYFDDALTDRVHAREPYAARGQRRSRNANDGIFRRGGQQLLLSPEAAADGFTARFEIGLQMA